MARLELTKTVEQWIQETEAAREARYGAKVDAIYNQVVNAINNGRESVMLDDNSELLELVVVVNKILAEHRFCIRRSDGGMFRIRYWSDE